MEAVMYMGHFNPNPTMCPTLSPLIEKCHSMFVILFYLYSSLLYYSVKLIKFCLIHRYIQLLHQKLYQLSTSDYEEYVGILYSAYGAFAMTPEGSNIFKDWLQSVRR